jgi:outer membrane protein OmpA-like peptidoglycan-associated protein/opacity protein-like surface antigen
MFKKSLWMLTVFAGLLGASQAQAFDWFGGRLSIGGGYGRVDPKLPYAFKDTYEDGDMWTAHMKYFLNKNFSVVASYANLEPHLEGNKLDSYRLRPIVGSLRYNFFHNLPFSPYLTAGAGYSRNKHEVPNAATTKWEGFTYQGGLGLEFFITEGTSLGAEALYHHFEADGDNRPYRFASAVGMVNFYFGAGPSLKRTEAELEKQKAEAERARQEAERTRAEALSAQEAAAQAQQGQSDAQKATTEAQARAAQAQVQMQQAQAEVDQIKQKVASKQIQPITFETGSAQLKDISNDTLNRVAEIAKKYPTLRLRVEGHTDSVGSAGLNQRLSQRRADAVRDYLTGAGAVPADQVTSVGFGPTRPIASNETAEGRSQNRRVEFIFALPQ